MIGIKLVNYRLAEININIFNLPKREELITVALIMINSQQTGMYIKGATSVAEYH